MPISKIHDKAASIMPAGEEHDSRAPTQVPEKSNANPKMTVNKLPPVPKGKYWYEMCPVLNRENLRDHQAPRW